MMNRPEYHYGGDEFLSHSSGRAKLRGMANLRLSRGIQAAELVGKFVCGSQPETKMEVTKKEVRGESKGVRRPEIDSAIIEELLKSYERPTDLTGPGGIIEELHKRLYERVLEAELTHYLGYGKGEAPWASGYSKARGAKFWLGIMNELNHRGLKDILVAVIDGLKGFPEATSAVYPDSEIQTCIVHLIRNSLSFCNWKDRKPVAAELKNIYNAETAELAAKRLEDFEQGPFGRRIPAIAQCWRRVWDQVIPFFAYPNEIRKMIYTTNAIESLHMQLRKVLKTRGHFPSDEAATKLIYLVLRDITKKWTNPPITWKLAATQFAIRFGQRFFAVEI